MKCLCCGIYPQIVVPDLGTRVVAGIFAPDRAQELFQVAAAIFEPLLRSVMQLLA